MVVKRKVAVKLTKTLLSPYSLGHALSSLSVMVLLFYGIFVWFGGYDSSFLVARFPVAFSFLDWTFVIGLIQTYAITYVLGWVFARIYNSY